MELTGRIIDIMEAKSGKSARTGNPWMIQEYVIEVSGQYPRRCVFTVYCPKDSSHCIMKDAKGHADFSNKNDLCGYCKSRIR